MTGPRSQVEGGDDVLMLLDIPRAHLHSPLARAVFVTIDGKVYKLLKAMYGLRDAGAAFDRKVLDVMNLMGVSLGKFSICVGVMDTLVRLVRWGDDLSLSGRRSLCNAFRDDLAKHLLVKTTVVMGPNVEMGDVQEAIHLNRLLRLYPPGAERGERWELEADPRHVEILVSQMGLSNESKAVSTPVVRTTDEEDGKELDAEGRACYRSWTMRASYLSQDRRELQLAVKELARRMQQPNTKNTQALKRLVRFLKGSPRCLIVCNRQAEQPIVDVATSSGEAEFYALTKSASRALGAVAMAADMSKVVKPRVRVDATKARSGASETSPHQSLVGARGGGTP